jgi:hypothetical protein
MKERPILFSAPMVRAILSGSKTQTRRVVKPQPAGSFLGLIERPIRSSKDPPVLRAWFQAGAKEQSSREITCPYGSPGDRLWVRETWAVQHEYDAAAPSEHYAATEDLGGLRKRQSIFLPRRGSRILLEITDTRVQRLQEISEENARSEGLSTVTNDGSLCKWGIPDADGLPGTDDDGWPWRDWERCPVAAYRRLWESINGSGTWDLNPWVWAVSFRRLQP